MRPALLGTATVLLLMQLSPAASAAALNDWLWPSGWYGFKYAANRQAATDAYLTTNCAGGDKITWIHPTGTTFDRLCKAKGLRCVTVCDWEGNKQACGEPHQRPGRGDGTRIGYCQGGVVAQVVADPGCPLACTRQVDPACASACALSCSAERFASGIAAVPACKECADRCLKAPGKRYRMAVCFFRKCLTPNPAVDRRDLVEQLDAEFPPSVRKFLPPLEWPR